MPVNSPKRPPYCNSISGFNFDHITAVDREVMLHQSVKLYPHQNTCGQSGHTPLVYTAACHAARRDPDWTMPDALYRGRAGCSSLRGVVVLVIVLIVVLVLIVAIR